jgi:uncharacterized membrane protein
VTIRLREVAERVRHSLWFVPTLSVLIAAAASLGAVGISDAIGQEAADLPIIFGAGPDGARAMLQAIAGSVITVAGVTFSITIVALQLTSTQFSPRVLRNFLRDRPNQIVLGVFMGTFTYCLLVLRSIRAEDELRGAAFVPNLAITGALVLAFVSLGMLIYFIHHISVRIQVTSIVASVARETLRTIDHVTRWAEPDEGRGWLPGTAEAPAPAPPSGAVPARDVDQASALVTAQESGNLQLVDLARLVHGARESGGRYRLLVAPGAWVQHRAPVATFTADAGTTETPDEHVRRLADALVVGDERSTQQDVAFGIQQLVDIAVKALSPSVNDPTTAIGCLDRLLEVLTAAGLADDPPTAFADVEGRVRLEVPYPGFAQLVPLAFDQVRHYGASAPAIVIHLARVLTVLVSTVPEGRHAALLAQAALLAEAAARITPETDRARCMTAIQPLLR